jgi:hypothetical protein
MRLDGHMRSQGMKRKHSSNWEIPLSLWGGQAGGDPDLESGKVAHILESKPALGMAILLLVQLIWMCLSNVISSKQRLFKYYKLPSFTHISILPS